MKDALNRRSRFAKPLPLRAELEITKADLLLFEALYRHGQLPAPYLYEFGKSLRKNYRYHIRRLTDLYHGVCRHLEHRRRGFGDLAHQCAPVSYLGRSSQQYMTSRARYQPGVYQLTDDARTLLLGARFKLGRSGSFVHDLFVGCFTASAELTLPFVFRDQIIALAPRKSFDFDGLEPDDIFGVRLEQGYRFYALEVDRGTEPVNSKRPRNSSISQKVEAYERAFATNLVKDQLGIPNLSVLIATTSETRINNMRASIAKSPFAHRFYFKAFPQFGELWSVPTTPLEVVEGWTGTKGGFELNRKAPS